MDEEGTVNVKGVDTEAWDLLIAMRDEQRRFMGAILSDALMDYRDTHYADVLDHSSIT